MEGEEDKEEVEEEACSEAGEREAGRGSVGVRLRGGEGDSALASHSLARLAT